MKATSKLLIVILLLVFIPIPKQSIATETTMKFSNILISTDESNYLHQVEPTMALSGDGEIFIAFKNAYTFDGGGEKVSFVMSPDNGESFSNPVEMSNFDPSHPSIQSDAWMQYFNGTLYFLYLESDFNTFSQMTMAQSDNYGSSFTTVSSTSALNFADKEMFAIDSDGSIYEVYDDVGSNVVLRLSRSTDGGKTFYDNVSVTEGDIVGPYIVPDLHNDNLYLAYTVLGNTPEQSDVFFTRSEDNGETWSKPIDINSASNGSWFTSGISGRPSVVTLASMEQDPESGRIWLAWEDTSANTTYGNYDFNVWLTYSDDNGSTWADRIMVNQYTNDKQWMPDIELDSMGNVHIAFYDESAVDSYDVKYKVYMIDSQEFTKEITVTNTSTSSVFTRPGDYLTLRLDKNDVPYIVWSDGRDGEMDVYFGKLSESVTSPSTSSTVMSSTTTSDISTNSSSSTEVASSPTSSPLPYPLASFLLLPLFYRKMDRKS